MKLMLDEIVALKHICVRAYSFELAAKFRDEEKRILKAMPKYKRGLLVNKKTPFGQWKKISGVVVHFPPDIDLTAIKNLVLDAKVPEKKKKSYTQKGWGQSESSQVEKIPASSTGTSL